MKRLLILLFPLISTVTLSQTHEITGIILDEEGKRMDLASVNLFSLPDSSFVKTEFTDQDGSYILSNVKGGNYYLLIKQFGYFDHTESVEVLGDTKIANLKLRVDAQELDQVEVVSSIPFIERKIDRVVVTPDALIANAGSNALEVLERAPGVTVDQNGVISLKGRPGVAVFINDKPTYMSGNQLENYLKTLPAGSIKNIEIMENPPAKYEAEGNAGVININIKRTTISGFFGNTSVSYERSRYNESNNSLNLNYNKKKIGVYLNVYGGFWAGFQDLKINRHYLNEDYTPSSNFSQNSFDISKGRYLESKTGLDYYISDKSTLGFSLGSSISPNTSNLDNTALVTSPTGDLLQRVVADNLTESNFRNNLFNVYFSRNLDSLGSKLSLDADYANYATNNQQLFKNYIYNPSDQLTYEDQINGEIPSEISIYALKSDFTKTLKGNSKFDGGLKTVVTQTDNEAIYSTTINGTTTPNYSLSNRFKYNEWINSAYMNYNREIGKVELQLGLRAEVTKLEGNQLGNDVSPASSFTRNYTSLFPTFYVASELDSAENHGINFSYGRRINRPYFQDLNPFVRPLDKFTFYTGNPNLLPTFSHNLTLGHSYKNTINTSVSYSYVTDGIQETLEIQDSIYFSRPGNIASSQFLTFSVDGTFQISKWYSLTFYSEAGFVSFRSDLYTERLNSKGLNLYIQGTNSFNLGKGWKIDVNGRISNNHVASQLVIKGYGVVDFGIQKTILNGKGSIKIAVNDAFHTLRVNGIINNLQLTNADWQSTYNTRSIRATFSIRFGKSMMDKEKHNSSGSESEQERVKG